MLTEINLSNYILINQLKLKLSNGMTVITGETGAGKSILVGALNLIFAKSNAQNIANNPEKSTYLEITYQISPQNLDAIEHLSDMGIILEDNELILAREIDPSGKSFFYLNGRKTTGSNLKELYPLLIDFHHQRDQQKLLDPAFQVDVLDQYGGLFHLWSDFQSGLKKLKALLKKKQELRETQQRNKQLCELYRFQLDELSEANLKQDEDAGLEQEYNLLSHSEEIITLSEEIYNELYEQENSLYDTISHLVARLRKFADLNSSIIDVYANLENSLDYIQSAGSGLRILNQQVSSDPQRLEDIKNRLDLINNLKTKYKLNTIPEILDYKQRIEHEIKSQDNNLEQLELLSAEIVELFKTITGQADKLTEKRFAAAKKLSADVLKNIKKLAMPNARFEIRIDKKSSEEIILDNINRIYSDTGQDSIDTCFSANPGSPVLPLKAIVSGGELSRILLAVKQSLSKVMQPKAIILDEIDVGIGGKTAGTIAESMHELAANFQVFCITHLAQIAAVADSHVFIDKRVVKNSTVIDVSTLDKQDRVNEIARMLSGNVTESSVQHAREIIK